MTAFNIRPATLADLDSVMIVMQSAFHPQYGEAWTSSQCESTISLPGAHLLLAQECATALPCGFALTRIVGTEAELLLIAVAASFQGQGAGRKLLYGATESAAKLGAKSLYLEVRQDNPAASLYEHVGFIQVGQRPRYYQGISGQFFDSLTYQLRLHD